jgi:glutamate dehydrogenase (NAD(P)+)
VRVVAVSDQYGAAYNSSGLDITALGAHVDATGRVEGFAEASPLDGAALLELDVDVLIPAALEGVINDTNVDRVRASIIVEGANGPTTNAADAKLNDAGVLIVPDILANAGGVIVSYFEWSQANQTYRWPLDLVEERLRERILASWDAVSSAAGAHGRTLREAAMLTAVERVTEAHAARGLYP